MIVEVFNLLLNIDHTCSLIEDSSEFHVLVEDLTVLLNGVDKFIPLSVFFEAHRVVVRMVVAGLWCQGRR